MLDSHFVNLAKIIISSCSLAYFCKIVNYRIYETNKEKHFISFNSKEFLRIFFCCFLICTIFKLISIFCTTLVQNPNYHIGNANAVIIYCSIIFGFFESLLLLSYCIDLKLASLFDLNKIQFLVLCNFKNYISFVITVILHSIYIFILIMLTSITIILPLILMTYYVFFIADIQAQFIRKVYKMDT